MTIKRASLLINATIIIIIAFAGVSLVNLTWRINEFNTASNNRFYSILLVSELRQSSEELTRQVRNYAVTGSQEAENAYNNVLAVRGGQTARPSDSLVAPGQKRVLLDLLREYGITDAEYGLVQQANNLSDALVALEVEAMNAVKGIYKDASGQYTVHGEPDRDLAVKLVFGTDYDSEVSKIMAPMDAFEKQVHERTDKTMEHAKDSEKTAELISFLSLGAVLFSALFSVMFNLTRIIQPLGVIIGTLKTVVVDGTMYLGRRINIKKKNEIGEMADFFDKTFESIGSLVKIIKEKSDILTGLGTDLSSNMNETAAAINEITANIQSIKGSVTNQNNSIGATGKTMESLVINIKKLDEHIENQSTHFEIASTSIKQMVNNISTVTDTLIKNEDNVETLTEASEVGRTGLQEVSTDIQEIARESEGLLEINAVMENIASQTNLLSMNAAIEAAHAGELGKGFAVVADEIRKLAVSSSDQSKTIGTVLKKIKTSIDKITRSTENVLAKFEAIDSSVRTVAAQEGNIRNSMEEQGTGSRQILEEVEGLQKITHEVAGDSHVMLDFAKDVMQGGIDLGKSTAEVTSGMNEMAIGAEQVNIAVHHVNDLSIKNREGIEVLIKEVSRFNVD